ncbi:MAG: hypothetical protein V3V81_07525 [Candidatus Bathyarchaeia archaeon]
MPRTTEEEPELIIMHETPIGSIVSDIFTFTIMLGAFWVNYAYIGNAIVMQMIIGVTIIAFIVRTCKSVTIRGRENIIKFLREYEKEKNDA